MTLYIDLRRQKLLMLDILIQDFILLLTIIIVRLDVT